MNKLQMIPKDECKDVLKFLRGKRIVEVTSESTRDAKNKTVKLTRAPTFERKVKTARLEVPKAKTMKKGKATREVKKEKAHDASTVSRARIMPCACRLTR